MKEGIRFARSTATFGQSNINNFVKNKSGMYMYGVGNVDWPQQV